MRGPIEILRGSYAPGDVIEKAMRQIGFEFENHQWKIPFSWIDPNTFLNSRLPSKIAVPPKRIIAMPGQAAHGKIVCSLNAYGLPELHLEIIGEEEEHEPMNLCETLSDWAYVDTSIAAHAGSTLSAVASGAVSLVTDSIPVWAEASAILAIISTIPRKRVRLLLNFSDREPMVIETAEVVAILLDEVGVGGADEDSTGDAEGDAKEQEIHVMF